MKIKKLINYRIGFYKLNRIISDISGLIIAINYKDLTNIKLQQKIQWFQSLRPLMSVGIFILIFLSQSVFFACPKCNQDFYKELMGQRGNTLGGQELLEAIKNQSIAGEPQPPVLPASYNQETDIKNMDTVDTDDVNKDDGSAHVSYYSYIIVFISLTFI